MNIYKISWMQCDLSRIGEDCQPYSEWGFDVVTASNGDRAIDAVKIARPTAEVSNYPELLIEDV